MAGFRICVSTNDNLILINQPTKPIKMLFVDDFTVVFIFKRVFPELLLDLLNYFGNEFILDTALTKDVVRSNTGLTAVKIFSPNNSLCGKFDICGCIYYTRTLSTKF